ncbi:cation-dependent mannose-6-phosphate receptor-like [Halichondria panicea]|uniref:cation-dependent mannose-6-phosphate receptor-like n=1 Tax=Halichondria panicea TaxID=6063 RepID=UPI00312BA131
MMFQILSLVVLALASVNAEYKPDCTDPCTCNGVSWKGQFTYPFNFSSQDTNKQTYEYVFSPCGAKIECGNTKKPVVICQIDHSTGSYVVVGASSSVVWAFANESDTNHFTVTYGHGDETVDVTLVGPIPRKGVVSVTVTSQDSSFVFSKETTLTTALEYEFNANIPSGDTGVPLGTVGIVLICLVLGAVILYFIIGSIVMFQVKGARGIEVVPNYSFWKDLPFLIKDGVLFMFQPCRSKKNTYSSL